MQKYLPKTWIPPPSRRGLSGGKVLETSPFSSRSFSALIQESLKEMLKRAEEEEEREVFGMLHAFLLQNEGVSMVRGDRPGQKLYPSCYLGFSEIHIVEFRRLKAPKVQ